MANLIHGICVLGVYTVNVVGECNISVNVLSFK